MLAVPGYRASVPVLVTIVVGWLIAGAALVSGTLWLFAVAAPFLVFPGIVTLMSRPAWDHLVAAALSSTIYRSDYRERVGASRALRRSTSAGLVAIGVGWFVLGLLV
jgi:hypothetical protein